MNIVHAGATCVRPHVRAPRGEDATGGRGTRVRGETRAAAHTGDGSERLVSLGAAEWDDSPVESLLIAALAGAEPVRTAGQDMEHVRLLAESESPIPPILVHRSTMKVVDGMHRVLAARMRGDTRISARFFHGDEQDAFLLSIILNRRHGLPLTRADRVAAVERILRAHPEWSDRALAALAGVSPRSVAEIRRGLESGGGGPGSRIGRDGRSRPVDGGRRREHAYALLLANPSASLRAIARTAGISPATAADVRARLQQGLDPVPARERQRSQGTAGALERRRAPQGPPPSLTEILALAEKLRRDPAVRLSETGRTMLRMLDSCTVVAREKQKIIERLPPHCVDSAELVMHALADLCRSFGEELSRKRHETTERPGAGNPAVN